MDKIPSFTIDHNKLLRGIYVSRVDVFNGVTITTFDIRMKEPNRQPGLDQAGLRNNDEWKDKIVYWGPMGCRTGNYLIIAGEYKSSDIVELIKNTFEFVRDFDGEIPGLAPKDCGDWTCHNLEDAKHEAAIYVSEVLTNIKEENLVYPK